MKTAFLFPGQGAQCVGMGKEIFENYEEAKHIYDMAEKITSIDVKRMCFEGPEELLMKTENTQIAILTTSLAILEVLKKYGIEAKITAGLSLGEYTALVYGKYLSLEEAFRLIQKRGYYMGNFLPEETFSMAAVIGLDCGKIEDVCKIVRESGKFVVPANYNCQAQTVISGTLDGMEMTTKALKEAGAKRVIPLKTSGPFHTEKLAKAKALYQEELAKAKFETGCDIQVIKNIDGMPYTKEDNIKEILANHIISPVRFDKTIAYMKQQGVTRFIEIGPGKALTSFVKKDYLEAETYHVNDLDSLLQLIN